jgi:ABC-type nitrate/sulfonate/bicarbonate transport system ATPase subunit
MTAESLEINIERKAYRPSSGGASRLAIKNLELSVLDREFLCIVGPSGCGKTTLLNIISGLDKDAVGSVKLGNRRSLENTRISYMFQTPRLLPWLSVLENVQLVLDDTPENSDKAEKLLKQMDLTDSLNEFPNRLSGGMQRRVALARAFVTKPHFLLLDEPFVSLDLPVGNLLRQLLLNLWQQSPTTVIFVTHDLRESIFLADRIAFLSRGPSRVILSEPVSIARPRNLEDPEIDNFRKNLLSKHQSLLHGTASQNSETIIRNSN